ncbi:MAG: 6-pyruvoyltetrahydropterin/6-carboxytetrahydropterin synthase [Oceanicoccus sp.]|jgi:6-pyruvoyltetrahydropterin/6-carboxytetrahydropterin synthase
MTKTAERLTTIHIDKEDFNFSIAHFTIFSATERERLHGHNYQVSAEITAPVDDNGMTFDYKLYKERIRQCCENIDEYLLLPSLSPHLEIAEDDTFYRVEFNGELMYFLKSDTLLLPVLNSTVEEYSNYILEYLLSFSTDIQQYDVRELVIKVSSGPGQSGSSQWKK